MHCGSMYPKQENSEQSNDRFQQAKVPGHGTGSRKGKQTRKKKKGRETSKPDGFLEMKQFTFPEVITEAYAS